MTRSRQAAIPPITYTYHQTSNISHTLVGNKVVDHSYVDGASPIDKIR